MAGSTGASIAIPSSDRPTRPPKRIIICCDGTWMSATSGEENVPSNVTRLARCLDNVGKDKDGQEWQQVVWYDSGIGTTSGWVGRQIEGASGRGLEAKVIEAYHFCVLNWRSGDKIMCFGFSRGAYTARSIAGLISDIGICKPDMLQHFHELWALYKKNKEDRFWLSKEWFTFAWGVEAGPTSKPSYMTKTSQGHDVVSELERRLLWLQNDFSSYDVEVVGVWDTVGALGFPHVLGFKPNFSFGPDKGRYHNVKLSPNIKNAFQALALDEHRSSFSPTLWHLPDRATWSDEELKRQEEEAIVAYQLWEDTCRDVDVSTAKKESLFKAWQELESRYWSNRESTRPHSNLLQVWFPGCHVNAGGGSSDTLKQKGDLEELSSMAFAWMLDQISDYVSINREAYFKEAKEHLIRIELLNKKAEAEADALRVHQEQVAKGGWGQWISENTKYYANRVAHPFTPAPSIKPKLREQHWGLGEIIDSYAGVFKANGSWRRTPGNYTMNESKPQLGVTNEQIHPSVGYRMRETSEHRDLTKRYGPFLWGPNEFVRQTRLDGIKGYEYKVKGSRQTIHEWKLKAAPKNTQWYDKSGRLDDRVPYERYVVHSHAAQKYVADLDEELGNEVQKMGVPPPPPKRDPQQPQP